MRQAGKTTIKAVLFDLDGVLYIGDDLLPGACESVTRIRNTPLPVAGVTNTTTSSRRAVAEKLAGFGIPIGIHDIYTPAALALQAIGKSRAALYVRDSLMEDFSGICISDDRPEYIVMGDLGSNGYTPAVLHRIFTQVMDGGILLALHKNRFWQTPDGLYLDLGPFVAAIEYATGKTATVLGKPSASFFHGICSALQVSPQQALMIGDDIESDIGGAQQAGLRTALVKTGKYREAFVHQSGIKADLVLPSIADLPDALQRL
ncbi:MAG: TIGR01458 family HAD-type hydrolase [Zetaproteobacteria bacterium CG12_big_fil_rev_8_21_14_0_65_54_13]|nr:MAG: TIGR01458 family HAD-type hydrolase [Zetaproteobacteria bacterium CG12_big_fil_rev_8_21_14_0_65_54_13]PIX54100.1 MAG: TIGR01458 family HAD-type hydrolase [Zetaproteobacteria bacterium CG_4_10_14_3_um_filter_54_28]PJA27173.1 MAG: TIGR01458 family HAD-type hydrolase [Zetaproteobacteria bacterium CG_4_9_14_3_um_filter_54_145]